MRRRDYIALISVCPTTALAGCGGEIGESEEADTPDVSAEFEIRSLDTPTEVTQPATLPVEIEIENVGEVDGTYFGTLRQRPQGDTVTLESTVIEADISAGDTEVVTETFDPDGSGIVTYQLVDETIENEVMIIPESTAPRDLSVTLVSDWQEFGDVNRNAIRSATAEEPIIIGTKYRYWHGDSGTLNVFFDFTIRDEQGQQVAVQQEDSERLTDVRGWQSWERAIPFSTNEWGVGEFTATVQIRDNQTGDVSSSVTDTFELR